MGTSAADTYDYILIGGGIPALFAARELIGSGGRVAILERDILCSGAASRSAGIVTVQLPLRFDVKASLNSIRLIEEIDRLFGDDYRIIRSRGLLTLLPGSRVLDRFSLILKSNNINYRIIYDDELSHIVSDLRVDSGEVGLYTDRDLVIDVSRLCSALKREILDTDGVIYEKCGRVTLKIDADDKVYKVNGECIKYPLKAGTYILNVGAYTRDFFISNGLKEPLPRQIYYKCQLSSVTYRVRTDVPVIFDLSTRAYIVRESENRLLVGDGPCRVINDPSEGLYIDHEILYKVVFDLRERFPRIEEAKMVSSWAYPCDTTHDLLPVLGEHDAYRNLYLIYGLSSYGITRGPYLGIQLAKLASGRRIDPELTLLKPSREREGKDMDFTCYEPHTPII